MILSGRNPFRVTGAARGFAFLVLLVPALWARNVDAIAAAFFVGGLWSLGALLEWRGRHATLVVPVVESAVAGIVAASVLDSAPSTLGALLLGPLVGSVHNGLRGAALAVSAQLSCLVLLRFAAYDGLTTSQAGETVTWIVTGVGFALIGNFLHSVLRESRDPINAYRSAQHLLRQLLELSDDLDAGLDPLLLGAEILAEVRDELPVATLGIHVPRQETLVPLVTEDGSGEGDLGATGDVTVAAWVSGRAVTQDLTFAFPLRTGHNTVAVVCGVLSDRVVDAGRLVLPDRVRRLARRLEPKAVQLDTALLFATLREATTAQERSRLAREMHDGVAQDIASLGYVVDALRAKAESPQQEERLGMLRDRLTGVVAEIRRSVVTLRTNVGQSESLGAAISTVARNLSDVSGIAIHVTLDERTQRLRPEVEAELFRITQEAINNAVKHSGASAIEVHCQVQAPDALITVTDNGRGLTSPARATSHGLKIMRERALLVDADLDLDNTPSGGLRVAVRVPARRTTSSTTPQLAPLSERTAL